VYVANLQYTDGAKKGTVRGALAVPFAPEFHELKNNSALLTEVADISGGRVLTGNPREDKLFDHSSLFFPRTRRPLWKELAILWLILFLTDVAIRRVVLDFKGLKKNLQRFVARFSKSRSTEEVVDSLKKHQLEVRQKLKKSADPIHAHVIYEAPKGQSESSTHVTSATQNIESPKPTELKTDDKPKAQPAPPSYLERLKQAKRKAQDTINDENKPSDEEK
jgi:hypothetical protein